MAKKQSPMHLFVREVRKQGFLPDNTLREVLKPVVSSGGDLETLKKAFFEQGHLSHQQIELLDTIVAQKVKEALAESHSDNAIDDLNQQLASEIESDKAKAQEASKERFKKAKPQEKSPLKIMVKEIRSKGWVADGQLKKVLGVVLERGGDPRDFLKALKHINGIDEDQAAYLVHFTKCELEEQKKTTKAFRTKDELSDLEQALGGEVTLDVGPKNSSESGKPKKPQLPEHRPHSNKVRILPDEDEGLGGLFPPSESDDDFNLL